MEKETFILEHKNCTPYLDHDVMYGHVDVDWRSLEKVFKVRGVLSTRGTVDNLNNHIGNPNTRLVLRPMSDIDKEITLPNGESFVPLNRINEHTAHQGVKYQNGYGSAGGSVVFSYTRSHISFGLMEEIIEVYNMLASWHFDFNDLISKGLAVDINSISLPYGKQ